MPRRKKQQIKTNDINSMEGVMQETYNDACGQMIEAQNAIESMVNASLPTDVQDYALIAKSKIDALKVKDSAIKIKLEIAKLQNDVIKHHGNEKEALSVRTDGKVDLRDFSKIRKMLIEDAKKSNLENE